MSITLYQHILDTRKLHARVICRAIVRFARRAASTWSSTDPVQPMPPGLLKLGERGIRDFSRAKLSYPRH